MRKAEFSEGRNAAAGGAGNKWAFNVLDAKADAHTHLIVGSRGELFDRLLQDRGKNEPLWLDIVLIEDPELGPDTFVWTDAEGANLLSKLREDQVPTEAEMSAVHDNDPALVDLGGEGGNA